MTTDSFNESTGPGGRFISVDSQRLEECMATWRSKKMVGIHISSMGAFKGANVEFLKGYSDIKSVLVSEGAGIDLTGLRYLSELVHLGLTNCPEPVPLSQFKQLKTFAGHWSPKLDLGEGCEKLQLLTLFNYLFQDFSEFPYIPSVQQLELVQPKLISLKGIGLHTHLQELRFERCSKLSSIGAIVDLNEGRLESLVFSRCSKIADIESLGAMTKIKKLVLEYCGSIESLAFIQSCSQLEILSLYQTNIISGDLSPLLELPKLRFFGTVNKRHYSHSESELNQIFEKRHAALRPNR